MLPRTWGGFLCHSLPVVIGEVLTAVVNKMETLTSTMASSTSGKSFGSNVISDLSVDRCTESRYGWEPHQLAPPHFSILRQTVRSGAPAAAAVGDVQQVMHPSWSNLAANLPGVDGVQQALHPSWSNLAANLPGNDAAWEMTKRLLNISMYAVILCSFCLNYLWQCILNASYDTYRNYW